MKHAGQCLCAGLLLLAVAPVLAAQSTGAAQAPPVPRLDIFGFVMTDFGYGLRSADPIWFDVVRPTKLPAFERQFGRDGRTFAGVRQTKFGVKGFENTPWGELRTHFEFDSFGVGPDAGQTTIRPRHFYGEIGAFGAGQTHTQSVYGH
jgi:hypothetical protein